MMGGMWPTKMTLDAYEEAKKGVPAAITEAKALVTKAQALSASLAKHNITLTVPPPTKAGTDGQQVTQRLTPNSQLLTPALGVGSFFGHRGALTGTLYFANLAEDGHERIAPRTSATPETARVDVCLCGHARLRDRRRGRDMVGIVGGSDQPSTRNDPSRLYAVATEYPAAGLPSSAPVRSIRG